MRKLQNTLMSAVVSGTTA